MGAISSVEVVDPIGSDAFLAAFFEGPARERVGFSHPRELHLLDVRILESLPDHMSQCQAD